MRQHYAVFAGLVMVFLHALTGLLAQPFPLPQDAPLMEFSAARAAAHVSVLAAHPRPLGSEGHRLAREHLVRALEELDLSVEVETARVQLPRGTSGCDAERCELTVHNIVGRLSGEGPEGTLLLVAHYDTVPLSPGAGDNGVGVAVILETVRALTAQGPLNRDLLVLFSDAEELGLVGAQNFWKRSPQAAEVTVVVNLDGRGHRWPVLLMEVTSDELLEHYRHAVKRPWAFSVTNALYRLMPGDTDFSVFRQAGLPGYNLTFVHGIAAYHAPEDTPLALEPGLLQQMGEQTLALVRRLGTVSLSAPAPLEPTRGFFSWPWGGMVIYDPAWNGLLTAGVLLGLVGVVRQKARLSAAAVAGVVAVFTGGGVVVATAWVMQNYLPGAWVSHPLMAGVCLCLGGAGVVLAFRWSYARWDRVLSPSARFWGIALGQGYLLLLVSRYLPTAHYLVAWPLGLLVLGAGLLPPRHHSPVLWGIVWLSGCWLWLPIIYLSYIMLTLRQLGFTLAAILVATSWFTAGCLPRPTTAGIDLGDAQPSGRTRATLTGSGPAFPGESSNPR